MRRERPAREKRRKKQPAVMEGCPLLLLLLLMLLPTPLCLSSGYARFNAIASNRPPAWVPCPAIATFFGDESRLGRMTDCSRMIHMLIDPVFVFCITNEAWYVLSTTLPLQNDRTNNVTGKNPVVISIKLLVRKLCEH